jgi:hypothetical protein
MRLLTGVLLVILCSLTLVDVGKSWGFWAHREIHRVAIEVLPETMRPFFRRHADTLIGRSIEPDTRRFNNKQEGYYHYIEIDRYGSYPFLELPRSYDHAVEKFGKIRVDTNGTVPWRIADFTRKLTEAMRSGDQEDILYYASNLGHYIADAHVPLHAVENYDGQLTNQKGVHARWESRLPEKFGARYNLVVDSVTYLNDPLANAFAVVLASYTMADSVLKLDLTVREGIPPSELVKTVTRRGRTEHEYSDRFYARYHEALNSMVERRMKASVRSVASYWYTAWVDAGRPTLP